MTTKNKNLRIVFISAIACVLTLSFVFYIKINALIESGQSVNHTTQVTLELEKVIGNLKDAESGHRGYLLTHDNKFIETFKNGLDEYPKNIKAVQQLTINSPVQQKKLAAIKLLCQHRESYMRKMLAIDKLRKPTSSELLLGKSIMDSLRNEVNDMVAAENNLMKQQSNAFQKQINIAPVVMLILSLLALTILIIAYWQLNKSLLQTRKLKAETLEQSTQLDHITAIRESEKRFRNMVQQAPVAICVLRGKNFTVEAANDKQVQLWGKTRKQVMNIPFFTAIPEVAGQGFEKLLDSVYETGKPHVANETPVTLIRNGKEETIYVNFVYEPFYDSEHIIDGVFSVATEVTEQVLTRKIIERNEQRFQAAISAVQGILWTNSASGEMEGQQTGWSSLTGQSYDEYQGYGWAEAVHPDDAQPTIEAWNEAVKERKTFIFEHRVRTKDGQFRNFSIRAIPILNEDGTLR